MSKESSNNNDISLMVNLLRNNFDLVKFRELTGMYENAAMKEMLIGLKKVYTTNLYAEKDNLGKLEIYSNFTPFYNDGTYILSIIYDKEQGYLLSFDESNATDIQHTVNNIFAVYLGSLLKKSNGIFEVSFQDDEYTASCFTMMLLVNMFRIPSGDIKYLLYNADNYTMFNSVGQSIHSSDMVYTDSAKSAKEMKRIVEEPIPKSLKPIDCPFDKNGKKKDGLLSTVLKALLS